MARILLVDDEQGIQLLYREELEEKDYLVESAYTGEEALELFKHVQPDLVILDINMPGMNGLEALRQMKEIQPQLPVILCSAYPQFKQDLSSWASDAYIVKSANTDELMETVGRLLA